MATSIDLSSLEAALPPAGLQPGEQHGAVRTIPLEVRVLSWNVHQGEGGKAEPRNLLAPRVVKWINPDILLLQETKTDKLIKEIVKAASERNRSYMEVRASNKEESHVLYDSLKYQAIPRDKEVFPDRDRPDHRISLEEAFECSIQKIPEGRELRRGEAGGMRGLIKKRISVVGLKRNDQGWAAEIIIIFMSFHNVYNSHGREVREAAASGFCKIVVAMSDLTGSVVVAGADLNTENFEGAVMIPNYEMAHRRARKDKKDYFILAPHKKIVKSNVRALGFDQEDSGVENHLPAIITALERERHPHSLDDYKKSLDHDPLVCDLQVNIPI